MEIESYGKSDIGKHREIQEDSILISNELNLFIVADGMGGHNAGEIASKMAVEIIYEKMKEFLKTDIPLKDAIIKLIKIANAEIYERSIIEKDKNGMGTTVVLLFFYKGKYFIANIGDSRCYLLRNKKFTQLTEDHSYVYEQYKQGLLKKEEIEKSYYRNLITRAVGINDNVKTDIFIGDLEKNDLFLLCSDGLYSEVSEKDLKKIIIKKNSLKNKVETLIEKANLNGGNDNISVILVEVIDVQEEDVQLDKTVQRRVIKL